MINRNYKNEYSRIFRGRYANNVHINFNKFHNNNTLNSLIAVPVVYENREVGLTYPPFTIQEQQNVVKVKECFSFTN